MVFYDHKPSKIEAVGDGRYRYRWHIEEVTEQQNGGESTATDVHNQWCCDEVIVSRLDSNIILEAVIAYSWSASREQKLVNDYNAAQLGVYGSKTSDTAAAKVAAYTEFLNCRNKLKEHVDADCEEFGIE